MPWPSPRHPAPPTVEPRAAACSGGSRCAGARAGVYLRERRLVGKKGWAACQRAVVTVAGIKGDRKRTQWNVITASSSLRGRRRRDVPGRFALFLTRSTSSDGSSSSKWPCRDTAGQGSIVVDVKLQQMEELVRDEGDGTIEVWSLVRLRHVNQQAAKPSNATQPGISAW